MTKLGKHLVSNRSWNRYKNHISKFLNLDAGRQSIIWAKNIDQLLTHGEDRIPSYIRIDIEALCYYNAFRNWPLNEPSVSGETDEENLSIMISADYIEKLHDGLFWKKSDSLYEEDGYWDFNWQKDRFVINGITYRPSGDTNVSQAKDKALVFLIVLKRDRDTQLKFIENYKFNEGFSGKDSLDGFSGKDINLFAGKV